MKNVKLLEVMAQVRYWEDSEVNGQEDTDGSLIPLREGTFWHIKIELETGKILGWPEGTTANIHYKVCDEGEYWLTDYHGSRWHKLKGHYVPDDLLCWGDEGYGDYIIFNVNEEGFIESWEEPTLKEEDWT